MPTPTPAPAPTLKTPTVFKASHWAARFANALNQALPDGERVGVPLETRDEERNTRQRRNAMVYCLGEVRTAVHERDRARYDVAVCLWRTLTPHTIVETRLFTRACEAAENRMPFPARWDSVVKSARRGSLVFETLGLAFEVSK